MCDSLAFACLIFKNKNGLTNNYSGFLLAKFERKSEHWCDFKRKNYDICIYRQIDTEAQEDTNTKRSMLVSFSKNPKNAVCELKLSK